MAKDIGALFKDWGFIFKLIEAILCLVALIFLYATNGVYIGYASTAGLFCLVTIGYLFILIVLIVVYIFDETHHLIELLVLGVGVFLNIIAGVLLLVTFLTASDEDGHGYGMTVVVAILLIANGVVMIFDFIREVRK